MAIEIIDDGQHTSWEFVKDVEDWDGNPHACSFAHVQVSSEGNQKEIMGMGNMLQLFARDYS